MLSLNLDERRAREICRSLNLNFSLRRENLRHTAAFKTVTQSRAFARLYESTRKDQRRNFLTYLQEFGVDFSKQGVHIVDVGWKGSIQNNIFHALNQKVRVCGYYLGNLIPTQLSRKNIKKAILFSDYPQHTPYYLVYRNNTSLFEMILGASHGSADGYVSEKQSAADRNDTDDRGLSRREGFRGKVYPKTCDDRYERTLFVHHIKPIQTALFRLNMEINRLFIDSHAVFPRQLWFAKQHARMVFFPKMKEVSFFESLYHLENFGVFEFSQFKRNGSIPIIQRYQNLKAIMHNPALTLETGVWPPIILRRLGLGFLRYYEGMQRSRRAFYKKRWG
jgi:hypothetical protein